ncbi:MAG: hypothetical protein ACOYOK_10710, partial [Pseudobdellovibrionaceae bacterium]
LRNQILVQGHLSMSQYGLPGKERIMDYPFFYEGSKKGLTDSEIFTLAISDGSGAASKPCQSRMRFLGWC